MILYTLTCDARHGFESWFRDSAACEDQMADGLVVCPTCRSTRISKSIMAPAIRGPKETSGASGVASLDDRHREIRALLRTVRDTIIAEGRDVGARFPEEARRMHEGEIPAQPIHGRATPAEARGLLEDGILIMPLPVLPEELN